MLAAPARTKLSAKPLEPDRIEDAQAGAVLIEIVASQTIGARRHDPDVLHRTSFEYPGEMPLAILLVDRDADGCLPVLLRLQGPPHAAAPQVRRLLRVLLVRHRAMPAGPGGRASGMLHARLTLRRTSPKTQTVLLAAGTLSLGDQERGSGQRRLRVEGGSRAAQRRGAASSQPPVTLICLGPELPVVAT
jgi:hypothetical protein